MVGTLDALIAAAALFVAAHFLLSSAALRTPLNKVLGEQGFRALYSVIAAATFVWMLYAYGAAPYIALWDAPPVLRWVPLVIMPIALFLAVCGLTTRNPTAVGGEKLVADLVHDQSPGILRVTRHPFLWGTVLWAASHLVVNGDAASAILTGAVMVLALGGMWHIDKRREAALGSAWGPIAMTTSAIPFVALATKRTQMDWSGIGLWRVAVSLALYVALLYAHPWLFGVDALPV